MEKLKFKNSPALVKVIYISFFVFFFVFEFVYIYPMAWAFINSLKTGNEYTTNSIALPTSWGVWNTYKVNISIFGFTWSGEAIKLPVPIGNYFEVFSTFRITSQTRGDFYYFDMLFNSLWILVVHVTVNVLSSMLLAYALARFRFPGKNFLYSVVIFANTIPIIGSGPAAYKLAMNLQMVNNPAIIWLMWASGFDFAFIVFYGYFKGISASYSESAKMDGANNLTILFSVILPQIIPCLVAIAITQAIGIWNNYSISMVYMRDYPNLAYGMYVFQSNKFVAGLTNPMPSYFAAAVISCIPIIILYASTQNLILTNMTTGGLKG